MSEILITSPNGNHSAVADLGVADETPDVYKVQLADASSDSVVIPHLIGSQAVVTQNPNASRRKVSIMPIGDSITYGVIDSDNTESGGYRTYLWQALASSGYRVNFVGSEANGPKSVDRNHEGYRGQEIEQIANSVNNEITAEKPDVILLLAGTNDILHDNSDNAPRRLSAFIDRILKQLPDTTILVGTLPPNTESDEYSEQIRDFNAALGDIIDRKIRQGKSVKRVDLYNRLMDSDLEDDTHPTANGYKQMAQAWYEALTEVLDNANEQPGTDHPPTHPSGQPTTGDIFTFSGVTKTQALRSSTLAGTHYDRLIHFNPQEGDRIQLDFDGNLATVGPQERPGRLFNAGIQIEKTLKQAIKTAYADANLPRRGDQPLRRNQAVIFQHRKNFYLTVNNHRLGFQARNDLLVDLGRMTRADFAPGDFHTGRLTVTDYFV